MTDLIGRSRFLASGQDDLHSVTITELCDHAAALRARIAEMEEEGANLRRANIWLNDINRQLDDTRRADAARIVELEGALRDLIPPKGNKERAGLTGETISVRVSVAALAQARAALSGPTPLKPEDQHVGECRDARAALSGSTASAREEMEEAEKMAHAQAFSAGWDGGQAEIVEKLKDPVAVHVSMLRGTIAKPPLGALMHLRADEAAALKEAIRREAWLIAAEVCDGGPSDEWSADTRSGYELAMRECKAAIRALAEKGERDAPHRP